MPLDFMLGFARPFALFLPKLWWIHRTKSASRCWNAILPIVTIHIDQLVRRGSLANNHLQQTLSHQEVKFAISTQNNFWETPFAKLEFVKKIKTYNLYQAETAKNFKIKNGKKQTNQNLRKYKITKSNKTAIIDKTMW